MSSSSPIIVFTYNRPEHTLRLLNSLAANPEATKSILYVFCDGPKENCDDITLKKIEEVRSIVHQEKRFQRTIVIEKPQNKGLANSIIDGVTEVIDRHESAIVLEDDLVVSPYFLYYMNDSLQRYRDNDKVGQIGACNFFACGEKYPGSFFIPIPDCLGWATWKDRWQHFTSDAKHLLKQLETKDLFDKFNVYGSYDMKKMLEAQVDTMGTSWAVRWTAVCVLNDWLTLYPNPSLTQHIASDDATHANLDITPPMPHKKPVFKTVNVAELPDVITAMKRGYSGEGDYFGNFKNERRPGFFRRTVLPIIPHSLLQMWRKYKANLGK